MRTDESNFPGTPHRTRRTVAFLGCWSVALLAAGCAGTSGSGTATRMHYGDPVRVGDGEARTYVVTDDSGPREIGIALGADALRGLPAEYAMYEYVLPLPPEAATLPYKDVVLNWNPHGHVPPGIYDRPHFDFHFYTITDMERRQIGTADPAFTQKGARQPGVESIPAGYVLPEGTLEPEMGAHWIDPTAPEFRGQPFTRTFIFGSWDGHMTFFEPMVSLAYLETRPDSTYPIPIARQHDVRGFYPAAYRVRYDAGPREFRVGLTELAMRQ